MVGGAGTLLSAAEGVRESGLKGRKSGNDLHVVHVVESKLPDAIVSKHQ